MMKFKKMPKGTASNQICSEETIREFRKTDGEKKGGERDM